MEVEIINKKPLPKLHEVTTSAKPLTYRNFSAETDGAIVSTEKTNMLKNYSQQQMMRYC